MTEPYLILHKVRGESAFDIATRIEVTEGGSTPGPVWIIPTSGHRAYPVWWEELSLILRYKLFSIPIIPVEWPDHYTCNETPKPRPAPVSRPTTTDDFLV